MEKILIENYRGFDIEFDTDTEKFQCICSTGNEKESKSFSAVRNFIDEYKKANQDFVPFWVEPTPDRLYGKDEQLKVIGIRKDGRFVAENKKGDKEQISDYDSANYMLVNPKNKPILEGLSRQREIEEKQRIENNETRKKIISALTIVTLKEYKASLK